MTAPLIVINNYAIKDGRLDAFKEFLGKLFVALEAGDPGMLAVGAYLNDEGSKASIVQVRGDAASIRDYWRVLHQHTGRALEELVETTSVQLYGAPADFVGRGARHTARPGADTTVWPESLGGFARLATSIH